MSRALPHPAIDRSLLACPELVEGELFRVCGTSVINNNHAPGMLPCRGHSIHTGTSMPSAEDYAESKMDLGGHKVNVTSYRIGETFYCHITNVDPGATIARAEGKDRAQAE